jgi:hypothetical protein
MFLKGVFSIQSFTVLSYYLFFRIVIFSACIKNLSNSKGPFWRVTNKNLSISTLLKLFTLKPTKAKQY